MRQNKQLTYKQAKGSASKDTVGKRASRHKTPWEIASKLMANVPEEAWATVPSDLSINVDHSPLSANGI